MNDGQTAHLEAYLSTVWKRLEQGECDYGDRSFSADPQFLIAQIRQELSDISGWSAILDYRLARLSESLDRLTSHATIKSDL